MTTTDFFNYIQLGIEPIDKQNLFMLNLFKKVFDSTSSGQFNPKNSSIEELIAFADYKFSSEERWMRNSMYSLIDEHVQEHSWILNRMIELKNESDTKRSIINLDILQFINCRWQEHIRTSDARFEQYIAVKNIQDKN